MKVKLYLHGHLRDKVQRDMVEVEADTLLDALKNFEFKYRKKLKAPLDIGKWRIRVKDFETEESWRVPLFVNEIHIYPMFRMGKSGKSGGIVQVAIGVTLIAVGAVVATIGGSPQIGIPLMMSGVSMVAQGLLTLLYPQPDATTTDSKYLGSGQNTTKAGTRISFGYGLYKIAGQILSYNVSSSNIKVYGD